jgi:hypothetical protein
VRYIYLGTRDTDPALKGRPCDPVRRPDGRCVVGSGSQLVEFKDGSRRVPPSSANGAAMSSIVQLSDPVLRRKAEPVLEFSRRLRKLAYRMHRRCTASTGSV